MRYLAWSWDPDPQDTTYTVDYAYLLREAVAFAVFKRDRYSTLEEVEV